MTSRQRLEELLEAVADHDVAPATAADRIAALPYRDLGFARVDTHRELRQGAPEVILGSGKTPQQAAAIARALAEAGASSVLVTRADTRHALCGSRGAARCARARAREGDLGGAPPARATRACADRVGRHVRRSGGARGADPRRAARHARHGPRGRRCRRVASSRPGDPGSRSSRRGRRRRRHGRRARQRDRRTRTVPGDRRADERRLRIRPWRPDRAQRMLCSCADGLAVVGIDDGLGAGSIAARIARRAEVASP